MSNKTRIGYSGDLTVSKECMQQGRDNLIINNPIWNDNVCTWISPTIQSEFEEGFIF